MDAAKRILITGANRGIGYGLTREFVNRRWNVFAACRDPKEAKLLRSLSGEGLVILPLEVRDPASIDALAKEVGARTQSLDILVNNAGIHPDRSRNTIGQLDLAAVAETFTVNTLGPVAVTQAFLPLLRAGKGAVVANISSGAGSFKNLTLKPHYAYAMSKAALNMFTRRAAADLQPLGISVVSFSPGWVKTDMGGAEADVPLDDAAAALAKTIESLGARHNGMWLDRFGNISEYAW